MPLAKPPPIVPHGPWRSEEVALAVRPGAEPGLIGGLVDLLSAVFESMYVGEAVIGLLRLVGHGMVVVLHAVFHL